MALTLLRLKGSPRARAAAQAEEPIALVITNEDYIEAGRG